MSRFCCFSSVGVLALLLAVLLTSPVSAQTSGGGTGGTPSTDNDCYGVMSAFNITGTSGWTKLRTVTGSTYATGDSGYIIMGASASYANPSVSYSNDITVTLTNNSGYPEVNSFSTSIVADGDVANMTDPGDQAHSSAEFDGVLVSGYLTSNPNTSLSYNQSKPVTDTTDVVEDGDSQDFTGWSSGSASGSYVTP